MTLNEQLLLKTMEELRALAKLYKIKGYSKLRKQELCQKVEEVIKEKGIQFVYQFDEEQFEVFEELAQKGEIVSSIYTRKSCGFLNEIGFLSLCKANLMADVIVLPEEICVLYEKLEQAEGAKEKLQKQRAYFGLLKAYKDAITNFYGAVPVSFFKTLYEDLEKDTLEEEVLRDWLWREKALGRFNAVLEDYLVDESLYAVEDYDYKLLIEKTKDKPFYKPDKMQLMAYKEQLYYEKTAHTEALKAYLKEQYEVEEEDIDDMLLEIVTDTRIDVSGEEDPVESALNVLSYMAIEPEDKEERKQLVGLIEKIIKSVRRWLDRGYTLEETGTFGA